MAKIRPKKSNRRVLRRATAGVRTIAELNASMIELVCDHNRELPLDPISALVPVIEYRAGPDGKGTVNRLLAKLKRGPGEKI